MTIDISLIGTHGPRRAHQLQELILLVLWISTKASSIPSSYCFVPKLLMSSHLSVGGKDHTNSSNPLADPIGGGRNYLRRDDFCPCAACSRYGHHFSPREKAGPAGVSFWREFATVALIISFALVAHLIEIALWAAVFMICGEFHEFGLAYYHSAVNYTTLGYGDLIMSPKWRLLGPLEAANGILMFGVSTAMIFTLILRLTQTRFLDLKD